MAQRINSQSGGGEDRKLSKKRSNLKWPEWKSSLVRLSRCKRICQVKIWFRSVLAFTTGIVSVSTRWVGCEYPKTSHVCSCMYLNTEIENSKGDQNDNCMPLVFPVHAHVHAYADEYAVSTQVRNLSSVLHMYLVRIYPSYTELSGDEG